MARSSFPRRERRPFQPGLLTGLAFLFAVLAFSAAKSGWAAILTDDPGIQILTEAGCNASDNVSAETEPNVFIGRQLFDASGKPVAPGQGCSGPLAVAAAHASRWGLVRLRLDRNAWRFETIAVLLAPNTPVTKGPLRGAIVRSAYDPIVAKFDGRRLLAFECIVSKAPRVVGTSVCLAPFDGDKLDLTRLEVVVSGAQEKGPNGSPLFQSASVPQMLNWAGKLYLYWSMATVDQGRFTRVAIRGAELRPRSDGLFWVLGSHGPVPSNGPSSTEIWSPVAGDALTDTSVDIRAVWPARGRIVMLAGVGGSGCARPGPEPGCFRMAISTAVTPLGKGVFNKNARYDLEIFPSNSQDYTRPFKDTDGVFSFLGFFYRPSANGVSEKRALPQAWADVRANGVLVKFPFLDRDLWPDEP